MHKILRTAVLFAAVVACPTLVAAQSMPEWARKVKTGKAIFVMTTDGVQIEGKAGPVSREGLVVVTHTGSRVLRYEEIFRAERKDSAWSGLAYGAALGFGVGVISWKTTDCAGEVLRGFCEGMAGLGVVLYTPAAALLGWGIDAAVTGRRTIYEASPPPRVTLKLSPAHGAVTIAW